MHWPSIVLASSIAPAPGCACIFDAVGPLGALEVQGQERDQGEEEQDREEVDLE